MKNILTKNSLSFMFAMAVAIQSYASQELEVVIEDIRRPPVMAPEQQPEYIPNCGKEACLSNDRKSIRSNRKIKEITVCFKDVPGRIPGERIPNDMEDIVGFDDETEASSTMFNDHLLVNYTRPITNNGYCKTWSISSYNLNFAKVDIGRTYCKNWITWIMLFTGSAKCAGPLEKYIYPREYLVTYPEITRVVLEAEKN